MILNNFKPTSKFLMKFMTVFFVGVFFLSSCDKRSTERGFSYLPDMEKSQAYDTYSENPNFKNKATLRLPLEGTIPRDIVPYTLLKTDHDLMFAGEKYKNPYKGNKANMLKGELQYNRFCSHCHGIKGDGKGFLYTSGKYAVPPANLLDKKTISRPDGEIYHIINVGINIMGAHASQISQSDRWKIIVYIRDNLQK